MLEIFRERHIFSRIFQLDYIGFPINYSPFGILRMSEVIYFLGLSMYKWSSFLETFFSEYIEVFKQSFSDFKKIWKDSYLCLFFLSICTKLLTMYQPIVFTPQFIKYSLVDNALITLSFGISQILFQGILRLYNIEMIWWESIT